jgi:hypothetical protein
VESVIGANAVRITRLRDDGKPDWGNSVGAFLVCGGISTFEHNFEVEEGSSIFQRDAAGNLCVNRKRQDDVKYTTFSLTMCRDDPRLTEIILHGGATLLEDEAGYPMGRGIIAGASCGETTSSNGVVIELWSELYDCDVPKTDWPFLRTVLPRAYLTPQGYTREDGVSLPIYQGFAQANPAIDNGPFNDFNVVGDLTNLIYFDFYDDSIPNCASPLDYVSVPANASS